MKENKSPKSSSNVLFVAGPNSKYKLSGAKPAGFWAGFWHGIVAGLIFFIGLFTACIATNKEFSRD